MALWIRRAYYWGAPSESPVPPDPPLLPDRDPGLRAAAALFHATVARIRSERLIEKAAYAAEASQKRRETAAKLLAAALLADPVAN